MAKKQITLMLDEKIFTDFRNYCKLNAMKISAKVELLLKRELENASLNPTLVKLFQEMIQKSKYGGNKSLSDDTQEIKLGIEETKTEIRRPSYVEQKPQEMHTRSHEQRQEPVNQNYQKQPESQVQETNAQSNPYYEQVRQTQERVEQQNQPLEEAPKKKNIPSIDTLRRRRGL